MKLTVFTPTYNRAYILPQLYESLRSQTSKDFEWLVIDDGSTDNTKNLFDEWMTTETSFKIRYYLQENGGKHRAINKGVSLTENELFFIVDSDDYLTSNAVEWILGTYKGIADDEKFAGLSGIRITTDGKKVGGGDDFGILDTDAISLRLIHNIQGDMAEVYKTDILRKYPFLEVPGERFCTEALVWNRIAQKYKLRYIYQGIYVCEYLPDGLTARIMRERRRSPIASMTYYAEYSHLKIRKLQCFKGCINFWRFTPMRFYKKSVDYGMLIPMSFFAWPLGVAMRLNDTRNL